MKPRAFNLKPGESTSAAIGRMYRHIQEIKKSAQQTQKPIPKAVSRRNLKNLALASKTAKPVLRLVKG